MKRLLLITIVLNVLVLGDERKAEEPGFSLPRPSGEYSIGSRFLYLVDTSREDTYTSETDDFRSISVRAWYPAEPEDGATPMDYSNREAAEYFLRLGFFKPEFIDQVVLKPSHSYLDAVVARAPSAFPVILFSASGVMDASILLAEDLASHGYAVFVIGHPHWCEYTFDAQGNVTFTDKSNRIYRRMWAEENSAVVRQTKEKLTRAKTPEEKLAWQRQLNEKMPVEISDIRLWVEDLGFVIDELAKMNGKGGFFEGTLDLENIGVMGYSKGGAAAGQACISDSRIRAGVNLSGFMFGDVGQVDMPVPFMVMEGVESWCEDCLPINDALSISSSSSVFLVQIHGATHGNFCDLPAYGQFLNERFQRILGPIPGRRFLKIQNDYTLQFFNKYLKGMDSPHLDGPPEQYPEVAFKASHQAKSS